MPLQGIIETIRRSNEYIDLLRSLKEPRQSSESTTAPGLGILRSSRGAILSCLQSDWQGAMLVISASPQRARALADEIEYLGNDNGPVHCFHAPDALFYDPTPWDPSTSQARAGVLSALTAPDQSQTGTIVSVSVWALMSLSASRLAFRRAPIKLAVGQQLSQYQLLEYCVKLGYEPAVVVEERGTFSHRGSIVDFFPPTEEHPIRIDFFGDEIDSIRSFSPSSQRSLQTLQEIMLAPTVEALPEWGPAAAAALAKLDLSTCDAETQQRIRDHIERLAQGHIFAGIEYYMPYLYPRISCIMDYMPQDTLVLFDDAVAVEAEAGRLEEQSSALRQELCAAGRLPQEWPQAYLDWNAAYNRLARSSIVNLTYAEGETTEVDSRFFIPSPLYSGQIDTAIDELVERQQRGERVVLVSRQAERLADLLGDHNTIVTPVRDLENMPAEGRITLVDGILDRGWMLPSQKLVVLTDAELFGWARVQRRRKTRREFAPESRFFEFKPGDYVVHVDHGIGQYNGITQKSIGPVTREYLEIIYADTDRLYVPIQQADNVTRYVGADERSPRIHRLGGTEWKVVRERAEKAVRKLAVDLLELYASRQILPGYAFSADNAWQRELEASFPYEETADQLTALIEVKEDMQIPRPMDRLLCGDVGYGKTEVALRAVFKAVIDGKQVAILVPTTVLAQQHFYTFRRRLRAFPVTVEMLSRFRTPQEQERVIEGLVNGSVDVVIGTHRLLSKDVSFKDLGLVVIDEEQRFGVQHKETLTNLRRQVDVLTMTATPIPRTLSLALSGARDMSIINTPPEERLPVHTTVAKLDWSLVRKSILREIDRGGQIFFVHNRVHDIDSVAEKLREVVPEASLTIGHGQMGEGELAQVMLGFARGEHDILLCTTIIESGLDIPNANTIIIDRADMFGLAQLYQLRGRVGRGTNRGYAYLFYKPPLSEIAQQRLETIQEATELGAGYQVAMRDLEIRGAGDILGAEQHGHIAAVGFDLYTRLLRQAIDNLKSTHGDLHEAASKAQHEIAVQQLATPEAASLDLPISTYIPDSFISDDNLRLRFYRRMAAISTLDQVDALEQELQDRFGELVEPVQGLVYALRVKVLADQAGIQAIRPEQQLLVIMLPIPLTSQGATVLTKRISGLVARGTRLEMSMGNDWQDRLLRLLALIADLELVPAQVQ